MYVILIKLFLCIKNILTFKWYNNKLIKRFHFRWVQVSVHTQRKSKNIHSPQWFVGLNLNVKLRKIETWIKHFCAQMVEGIPHGSPAAVLARRQCPWERSRPVFPYSARGQRSPINKKREETFVRTLLLRARAGFVPLLSNIFKSPRPFSFFFPLQSSPPRTAIAGLPRFKHRLGRHGAHN